VIDSSREKRNSSARKRSTNLILAPAFLFACMLAVAHTAEAQTLTTLFSFNGTDGSRPQGSLVQDSAGNLYGMTFLGGANTDGVVFKLTLAGSETVLYNFKLAVSGSNPYAGPIMESAGNLYGTTNLGQAQSDTGCVFKLTPTGSLTVLYTFTCTTQTCPNGANPHSPLYRDTAGNLYGTTFDGVHGNVFKLTTTDTLTVLHTFGGSPDGSQPLAGVVADSTGNLYGTTTAGGTSGNGTVFKVTTVGVETVLHSFAGSTDGSSPDGNLIIDSSSNLYGTTASGGANGFGTVFKMTTKGVITTLHTFKGGTDGANPMENLVRDSAGNLYGTTYNGGAHSAGTIFKVTSAGVETVLYSFTGGTDGGYPISGLIRDSAGNLYGTTSSAGSNGKGTVFKLVP
jgi:uncharacterized repeat protein (TIGR03803 family)